jgi:membrane associated rhomboid family serine protease
MEKEPTFLNSLLFPLVLLLVIWIVFYIDQHLKLQAFQYGLIPRELSGLKGIFTMPFIHGDVIHILSNTFPFLILATMLQYNYPELSKSVMVGIYLISGFLVWCFADLDSLNFNSKSFHIGASGIVYGLSGFLFFSGIIRKRKELFAISLLVTFLYGTIIWGVFPEKFQKAIHYIPKTEKVSWEGHLFGFLSGVFLAFIYRKKGKQRPSYSWDINNDEDVDDSNPYWMVDENEEKEEQKNT